MEYLYSKIEICRALSNERESINYYVIKDDQYGLKITKAIQDKELDDQKIIAKNISTKEDDIKNIIDSIIGYGNDFSQIQYVVDDYKNLISRNF